MTRECLVSGQVGASEALRTKGSAAGRARQQY